MQLVEANVTVRCHGSTCLTVAVNGSHTAWLLPSSSQKDQTATECELRACHNSRCLEARRPDDLSQRAHIGELCTGSWKQLAYSITPPPGQGRNRRSSNPVYYLVPATGQILDGQGDLADDQQQHQQWAVPSIDYWQGHEVMELTVAEVVRLAQSGTRSPDADAGAAQTESGNAVRRQEQTVKPLADQMQLTVGTSTKRQQPKQQLQGSAKRARQDVHHSSQAGEGQQADLQQLLQLVVGGDHTMQDMLLSLLQQQGEMAFVQFMGLAVTQHGPGRRRGAMLIKALAQDKGNLMRSFLAAASSTNADIAAAAVAVLATLSEVADPEQFLSTVLVCSNGVVLLSRVLLDADSSPIIPDSGKEFCYRQYSEGGAASQPIRIFIGGAALQTVNSILQQCTRLLSPGSQPTDQQQSVQDRGAIALLVLLLVSMQNNAKQKVTVQAALRLTVQPLWSAAAAPGPYQSQFLAGLLWILGYGTGLDWDLWRQVPAAVPQLIQVLGQQRPAAKLADQLLHKVSRQHSGLEVLVEQIPQLVSMLSSPGPPLHVVNLLCTLASRTVVGSNALLPYLDMVLAVVVPTQQQHGICEGWGEQPDSLPTSALHWFSTLADEDAYSELIATPQRMQQLVALLVKLNPWCTDREWDMYAVAASSNVTSLLIEYTTGAKLLVTNQGLQSIAHLVWCSVLAYWWTNTSIAADMMAAICVVAAAAAEGSKSELVASSISSALSATDIDECMQTWWWCGELLQCFSSSCSSGASKLSSSLVVKMFGCLSSLAQLPAGAYHTAQQTQELQTIISDLQSSNYLSKEEVQVCLQHMTEMKACVTELQARLAATVVQLSADIQHALVACAQVHQLLRRDCTKRQLQLLLSMQLQRVTAATAAMGNVKRLQYVSQLNSS